MTIAINQKIVGFSVVNPEAAPHQPAQQIPATLLERPLVLAGRTYKLKTPLAEHALYITINDVEIDGQLRPFEIFVNCKDMTNFQWVVALTRVISAVFRHGGAVAFLVDELMSVVDPKGGYFFKGQYRASLVAEIGSILRDHLTRLGLFQVDTSLVDAAKAMVTEKQAKVKAEPDAEAELADDPDNNCPPNAELCLYCNMKAAVLMDGCLTCLSCGNSKCS